ncbi:sporulation protein YhbH [Phosphitispora sp. TUW77]|uniref:sporulation protein YhbH n=1 Tax=Phosphitispora sp. TUW77 TaxID=3152361 RepID=UPI003AB35690
MALRGVSYTVSKDDWSLHRKGHIDQRRHMEKVKEAIKKNLADIVAEESIIMSDGRKIVKVPIRSLDEFHFRFNRNKQKYVGQGDGNTKQGDVLGQDSNSQGPGKGSGAGHEPGVDYYEAEITVDELAQLIFEDLGLPNLKEKKQQELITDSLQFRDVRKKGIMSNIDKRRTIMESIRRNAVEGADKNIIKPDDLRFKTWDEDIKYQSNAVVIAMMDTSGSMGPFEKYIARSFFFWMVRFLRTKYQNVNIIFLAHHTIAKEVTEEEFFTKGESGGTRCSSVYELALEIIQKRFRPEDYNIYPFHFSDGDNLPSDDEKCLELVRKLLELCNIFGYGEIEGLYNNSSSLMSVYRKIKDEKFTSVLIKDKTGVYPALKTFFKPHIGNS